MREVQLITQTNGIGSWTAVRKKINIKSLDVIDGIELRAYFSVDDWDTYEHGFIYTDEGWLESFKKQLVTIGIHPKQCDGIGYSEYGMQGEEYVSLDVPDGFELLI